MCLLDILLLLKHGGLISRIPSFNKPLFFTSSPFPDGISFIDVLLSGKGFWILFIYYKVNNYGTVLYQLINKMTAHYLLWPNICTSTVEFFVFMFVQV